MGDTTRKTDPELWSAFTTYELQERVRNTKIGCFLVVTLMPAGTVLDYFVYPENLWVFLQLRLWCALIAAFTWGFLYTDRGKRSGQWSGIVLPLLPVIFIAKMIATTDGFESPYYAGLNLVLLAVGTVLHWTFVESIIAALSVLFIYTFVGIWHGPIVNPGIVFNNFYFIVLMDIVVVVGTYFQYKQRFLEFVLRFQLDQNRHKLEETNLRLVELDRIKSQFFANISHELRTPLTLLLAPLQTLIQEHGSALQADMRQLLLIMQSNGMRLFKLINDLLDLVRLESGKMEVKREPVAIERFLRGLISAVKKTAEDRGIRIEMSSDQNIGAVLTDSDKLERILLNLLFNALKFTPAGGKIQLNATHQDGELTLQVSDTGRGISEEQLSFVFDRFWQADTSSERKYGGMGIGLALVKELVEIQGGKVSVTSEIAKGTQFTIRLPHQKLDPQSNNMLDPAEDSAAPDSSLPSTQTHEDADTWLKNLSREAELHPSMTSLRETIRPVETSVHSGQPRVLIADDEPDMRKYLSSQLSSGFQVIEAVDGQQAIEKASQFLPDLIVCDIMMPEKNGFEVCRDLRERISTRSIPVLLLTARADEETKITALSAGANDFITKPFSTIELRVRIKNLVEAHNLQQAVSRQNQILEATIEQLKETEVQLVQSEKLASLGRMSAGIIHEINNPLNFTKTGLYVLRKSIESSGVNDQAALCEILRDMEDGMERISSIVSDLRTFTQPDVSQTKKAPVLEIVNSALRLLSNQWQDKVTIEKEIPERQTIWANRNQLTQVLVNLLQNALYALEKKRFFDSAATIWIRGIEENGESLIIVRDNGEGIRPENIYKIFDPFFTTKDVGEGMGLGLSICYRIVKHHGGRIHVQSEPGAYSQFTLYFPQRPTTSSIAA